MNLILPLITSAIGIAVLVYSYRNSKSSNSKIVPSLFFLKQLEPGTPRNKKKKLPFRFFLELLFIIILSALLMTEDSLSKAKRLRIIVDISQSMGTKLKDSTRLEEAKSALINLIETESSDTKYYLETSPTTNIKKDLLDQKDALSNINNLELINLSDNYSELAPLSIPITDTLIFTDKKVLGGSVNQKSIYFSPESNLALNTVSISTRDNASRVSVYYLFSGSGSNSFELLIEHVGQGRIISKSKHEILSGGTGSITIQLNEILDKDEIYKIGIQNSLQSNSLSSDDEIFFKPNEAGTPDILLISSNANNQESLTSLREILPGGTKFILESELGTLKKEERAQIPLTIYYQTDGPGEIFSPSLFITPRSSSKELEIKGTLSSPKISSWSEASQLTRYINFESLTLNAALKFKEVSWGNPVVRVNGAISLIEGQINNLPIIVSGIELLPFEGKKSPAASILALNAIKKLTSVTNTQKDIKLLQLEENESAEAIKSKKQYKAYDFLPTGAYLIQSTGKKRIEISNAFNITESDTKVLNEEIVGIKKGISKPKILESELLFYLAIASIFILILDIILILVLGREV
jgi:hypothetical protein